jgi:hypothetical protein
MTYATLAFRRLRYNAVKVTEAGQTRHLGEEAAQEYYAREVTGPAEQIYQQELAKQRKARMDFASTAVMHEPPTVRKERKAREGTDRVTLAGTNYDVPTGTVERFIRKQADNRYPDPPKPQVKEFASWYRLTAQERRVWQGWLLTADGYELATEELTTWGGHAFPVQDALRQLDKLQQEGWRLVHVSEDHGLYQGVDVSDEAYLTRVRYLLERD